MEQVFVDGASERVVWLRRRCCERGLAQEGCNEEACNEEACNEEARNEEARNEEARNEEGRNEEGCDQEACDQEACDQEACDQEGATRLTGMGYLPDEGFESGARSESALQLVLSKWQEGRDLSPHRLRE
jgi:hypothetical protein